MQYDPDLARTILFRVEAYPHDWFACEIPMEIEGYGTEMVSYYVRMLGGAGYMEVHDYSTLDRGAWVPVRMTYAGAQFLEYAREPGRWQQAKAVALEKGLSMTLSVLQTILQRLVIPS